MCHCTEQDKCITGCLQRIKAACIACKGADTGWDRLALAVCGREAGRIREYVPLTCLKVNDYSRLSMASTEGSENSQVRTFMFTKRQ